MQTLDPSFVADLQAAPDKGIAPAYFLWIIAKNRVTGADEPFGLWTGDDDINQAVQTPTGLLQSRPYYGGANLYVDPITYSGELVDESTTATMSQIAPATQELVRGFDVRGCYCEIHATSLNGTVFFSNPQISLIGIVDDVNIGTPEVGGEGNIGLVMRSQVMTQLIQINPAKSSDSHQKRRKANDAFSKYSGVIKSRDLQWFKDE